MHWISRATARCFAVLIIIVAWIGVASEGASAADCVSNFPWASEGEMASWDGSPTYDCDRNFVTDPGRGNVMNPNGTDPLTGLLSPARVAFYVNNGFSENFLWYAPRTTTVVGPTDSRTWTACRQGIAEGGICNDLKVGGIAPDFDAVASLQIIGDDRVFIALVCGNYSAGPDLRPPPPVPHPTPELTGVKFRDDDRDGVRDQGEAGLADWQIRITRESSLVGQAPGVVGTVVTGADGSYHFDLDGHGPGRYRVEETQQQGWKNYTAQSYVVNVGFGAGDKVFTRNFGNAETTADVAKLSIEVLDPPTTLDALVPVEVNVEVTVENQGPAERVTVEDELVAAAPEDCTIDQAEQTIEADLRRDVPVTVPFTFTIECDRPSEHLFTFHDTLTVTSPDITDPDLTNNELTGELTAPVWAETDLGVGADLACDPTTQVGEPFNCAVTVTITNNGFDDIDAETITSLALPQDCDADATEVVSVVPHLDDGGSATEDATFTVVCSHRSHHDIAASATVAPADPHVRDSGNDSDSDSGNGSSNDHATAGPEAVEVFHDATMAVTDVHLTCDESVGDTTFTCTAEVAYTETGPAPEVDVIVTATLDDTGACTTVDASQDLADTITAGDTPEATFTWTVECQASDDLHPFHATADVVPAPTEPHAVDDPGPVGDWWVVPYCQPTVNPHGQTPPAAPGRGGQGMNQDGFYLFGILPSDTTEQIRVRDDGSGTVFGPFADGTRIKWVEANGAQPSITPMAGNNGRSGRRGQATAVDFQIIARGDAQAVFVDERGIEIRETCLVPPAPQ
jgi:hypothetical protein